MRIKLPKPANDDQANMDLTPQKTRETMHLPDGRTLIFEEFTVEDMARTMTDEDGQV